MDRLGWLLLGTGAFLFTAGGHVDALRALDAKGLAVGLMLFSAPFLLVGMMALEQAYPSSSS